MLIFKFEFVFFVFGSGFVFYVLMLMFKFVIVFLCILVQSELMYFIVFNFFFNCVKIYYYFLIATSTSVCHLCNLCWWANEKDQNRTR